MNLNTILKQAQKVIDSQGSAGMGLKFLILKPDATPEEKLSFKKRKKKAKRKGYTVFAIKCRTKQQEDAQIASTRSLEIVPEIVPAVPEPEPVPVTKSSNTF